MPNGTIPSRCNGLLYSVGISLVFLLFLVLVSMQILQICPIHHRLFWPKPCIERCAQTQGSGKKGLLSHRYMETPHNPLPPQIPNQSLVALMLAGGWPALLPAIRGAQLIFDTSNSHCHTAAGRRSIVERAFELPW
jgi:hypothetical protein